MKKFIILLSVLSVCYGVLEKDWKLFKQEFNKTYNSGEEEQKRFKIFKENWNNINKHNKRYDKGLETYSQEINRFGDLTDNEFTETYGLSENNWISNYTIDNGSNQIDNDYLDWRAKGAVTPAKDQGKCGSCWIFSAVGNLESLYFRKTGNLETFSEQYIVDCISNESCDGGSPKWAFEFMKEKGVRLESDYPYNAEQNNCKNLTTPVLFVDFNSTCFQNSMDEVVLKEAVRQNGPLSVCLYVTYRWRFYKSGVWFHNQCSDFSNHCLVLVGYGTENGKNYWLIKNSWGPNWGENGFIKVARFKHQNYCGLYNAGNAYLI
ncbi:unnamed protein product [Phyllotreta striolata]|uniref:Uncharacterized protein n=1 Tax=Phyllotreta striolata TaxID=444603 RepID=A0A9N9TH11_PHYSR|nr:unnamed protein product [Phyllotreta striolata]